MYKYKNKRVLNEYRFLKSVNKSKLTFLEFCYWAGFITMKEWEQFRGLALRGGLNA